MKKVSRKRKPTVNAIVLSRRFLIKMVVFPLYWDSSSEVASSMMVVTASQRLISKKDKGNCILTPYFFFLRRNISKPEKRRAKPKRKWWITVIPIPKLMTSPVLVPKSVSVISLPHQIISNKVIQLIKVRVSNPKPIRYKPVSSIKK